MEQLKQYYESFLKQNPEEMRSAHIWKRSS